MLYAAYSNLLYTISRKYQLRMYVYAADSIKFMNMIMDRFKLGEENVRLYKICTDFNYKI